MDAKTLEALKASIAKWERNAEAEGSYDFMIGAIHCRLCALFITLPDQCDGCPVRERTGEQFCRQTPYIEAVAAQRDWYDDAPGAEARAHAAARDEVAFLKSLLPEETP